MVGKLGDIKEVCRQAAHELTGAVMVEIIKGELLHMAEQVPADIRLHQNSEGMAPIADDIGKHCPQGKGRKNNGHYREKYGIGTLRQQLIHAPAGNIRKCQIDQ